MADRAGARGRAPIVIVGSGYTGYSVAEAVRKRDPERDLVMITADAGERYYKPNLSNALGRGKAPDELVSAGAAAAADALGVRLCTHTRVAGIDRERRRVVTAAGDFGYERLVLALGADPMRPPLNGDAAGDVLSINDLADYRRFRERLAAGARVAVIGNGLIGCEFANDLAKADHPVSVVGLTGWPIDRLLPEPAGRRLQRALEEIGVDWHLEDQVSSVDSAGAGYRLRLAGGAVVAADLVLAAVGLQPRTALAQAAGLRIERGIVVDACMRTSDPAIHALGDCVELDGQLLPYIAPITHAADIVAAGALDDPTPAAFPPMPVMVKTPAHPVHALAPAPGQAGEWRIEEEAEGLRCLFHDGADALAGFVLTGRLVRERPKLVKACTAALPPYANERVAGA